MSYLSELIVEIINQAVRDGWVSKENAKRLDRIVEELEEHCEGQ